MLTQEEKQLNTNDELDGVPKDFIFEIINPLRIEQFKVQYDKFCSLQKPPKKPSEDFALQQLQQAYTTIETRVIQSHKRFFILSQENNTYEFINLTGKPAYFCYVTSTQLEESTEAIKEAIKKTSELCTQYSKTEALLYPQNNVSEALRSAFNTLSETFLEFSKVLSGTSKDEQFFKGFLTNFSHKFLQEDFKFISDSKGTSPEDKAIQKQVRTACELMGIKETSKVPGALDQGRQKLGTIFSKIKPQASQPLNDQLKSNAHDLKPDQEKIRRFYNLDAKIKSLPLVEIPSYFSKKEEEEKLFKAIPERREEAEKQSIALAKELADLSLLIPHPVLIAEAKAANERLQTIQKELDFTATQADIPALPILKNTNESISEDLNRTKNWLNESIKLLNRSIERTSLKLKENIGEIEQAQQLLEGKIKELRDYKQRKIDQCKEKKAKALEQAEIMGSLLEVKDENFYIPVWEGTTNTNLNTILTRYEEETKGLEDLFQNYKNTFIAEQQVEFNSLKAQVENSEYKLEDIPENHDLRKTFEDNQKKLHQTVQDTEQLLPRLARIQKAEIFQNNILPKLSKLFTTLQQQITCHNETVAKLEEYRLAYSQKELRLDTTINKALQTLKSECQTIAHASKTQLTPPIETYLTTYKEEKDIIDTVKSTLDQADRRLYNLVVLYIKLNKIRQSPHKMDIETYKADLIKCVKEEMTAEKMQHLSEPERCWISRFFRGLLESLYLSFKTSSTWVHNQRHEDNLRRPCSYDFFKSQGTPLSSETYNHLATMRKNLSEVAQEDSKDARQITPP